MVPRQTFDRWKGGILDMFGIVIDCVKKEDLVFYFCPLRSDAPFLIDLPKDVFLDFSKGAVCTINNVEIVPEYVTTIKL